MDQEAIIHSKERLAKAKYWLQHMSSTEDTGHIELAWGEFVLACGGVYLKLETGSKLNSKSKAWFGRKIGERRKDELLRYMHLARNTEEHGLRRIATHQGTTTLKQGQSMEIKFTDEKGNYEIVCSSAPEVITLKLVTVHDDRFDDQCSPPKAHKGKVLTDPTSPHEVANLMVAYIQEIIAEAEALALNPSL